MTGTTTTTTPAARRTTTPAARTTPAGDRDEEWEWWADDGVEWEVDGGGSTTYALYPNASNATISLGELSGNGSLAGTSTAGLTTWF